MLGREGHPVQRIVVQGRDRGVQTREKRWELIYTHSRVPDLNRPMKSGLIVAFTIPVTTGYNRNHTPIIAFRRLPPRGEGRMW